MTLQIRRLLQFRQSTDMSSPAPTSNNMTTAVDPAHGQSPATSSLHKENYQNDIVNDQDNRHNQIANDQIIHDDMVDNSENDQNNISDDINGHIYANVEGFWARFFEAKPWSSAAEPIVQAAKNHLDQDLQSREEFAVWLSQFQSNLPRSTVAQYLWLEEQPEPSTSSPNSLVLSRSNGNGRELRWADVLVIGEFCPDGPYQTGLLELCGRARAVLSYQPARLFLHGFYLYGGKMELWVFDRSGIYSCEAFNIAQAFDRFLTVLVGYMLMDDVELGVGTLIKEDSQGKYILCGDDATLEVKRLYLGDGTIFERTNKDIVSDGLTCYRARLSSSERWEYAIKIKWSTANQKSEVKMLEFVKEKNIWGVLRLFSHEAVCSTDALHHGLRFEAPRKFQHAAATSDLGNIGSALDHTVEAPETGNAKYGEHISNKTLNCIVVSPLGESLHRFETASECLSALRDAIKAHRSLYQDGEILHQDVCPGNIIIPFEDVKKEVTDPKGVMIDLDVAKKTSEPWKQFEGIGTPPFQAIGVLQAYLPNNPHTYRHDLESFLYTFLFLATCTRPVPPGENQLQLPPTSVLYQWTQGRPVDQAKRKTNDMNATNFSRITAEFTPKFKRLTDLAEQLRRILFHMKDGELWTGTDMTAKGTNAMYGSMIDAFDMAATSISSL